MPSHAEQCLKMIGKKFRAPISSNGTERYIPRCGSWNEGTEQKKRGKIGTCHKH